MALTVLTSHMSETLEYIVTKRQSNFDYLKRTHQGKVHWLNVVKLRKGEIVRWFPQEKMQKRLRRWFLLGVSLGRLLELSDGSTLVRALSQLLEEYEHWLLNTEKQLLAQQSVMGGSGGGGAGGGSNTSANHSGANNENRDTSNNSSSSSSSNHNKHAQIPLAERERGYLHSSGFPRSGWYTHPLNTLNATHNQSNHKLNSSDTNPEPIKPQLQKINKQVVYEYLQQPFCCTPVGQQDYCECVHSLMDVLSLVYAKFLDESCVPSVIHEAIVKCDRKIKQLIVAKISSDLTSISTPLLKSELKSLLNHMFIDESRSTPLVKKFYTLQQGEKGQDEEEWEGAEEGAEE